MFDRSDLSDRRLFLRSLTTTAAVASLKLVERPSIANQTQSANEQINVGIMGVNGRGGSLAQTFASLSNTSIRFLCDVDSRALGRAADAVNSLQNTKVQTVVDFRRVLDSSDVDVLIVAAPNHWHAPATILACNAGKHVYVEKPCSHNPREGELAVLAADKNKRVVQMGTQRRSWPVIREAIERIHRGDIGQTLYARTWYNNRRPTIGYGHSIDVPAWLDWRLWQGPAPDRPYRDNIVHYNWHWDWDWGNGELGNNGIHALDLARWALDVDFPIKVTAGGGHFRYADDQVTPDTMMVTYQFHDQKMITWEGISWSSMGVHDTQFGISIHGTDGTLIIRNADYAIYDTQEKLIEQREGDGGDTVHAANFMSAIRDGEPANATILEAHKSTLLCHLGNIAYRTNGALDTSPDDGSILNNETASLLWTRAYHPDWRL